MPMVLNATARRPAALKRELQPGDRVEYQPNNFNPGEKRFTGTLIAIDNDCAWVEVVARYGAKTKSVHRQWLTLLPPQAGYQPNFPR